MNPRHSDSTAPPPAGTTLPVVNEDGSPTDLVAIWKGPRRPARPAYLTLIQGGKK